MAGFVILVELLVAVRIGWPSWCAWRLGVRQARLLELARVGHPLAHQPGRTSLDGFVALDDELLLELAPWASLPARRVWARCPFAVSVVRRLDAWLIDGADLDVVVVPPDGIELRRDGERLAVELLTVPTR